MMNENLFPPIVDSYAPAFVVNNEGKGQVEIYYSISKYNDLSDINSVWVSVTNQYTNKSMLKTTDDNKTGLICFYGKPVEKNGRYLITLNHEDLLDQEWILNQYYKVQIRFCKHNPIEEKIDIKWITQYEDYFSEWSTVCLIKAIEQPELILRNFEDADENNNTIFTSLDAPIVGKVKFKDEEELESYQIFLYEQRDLSKEVYNSGVLYPENTASGEINHLIKYGLIDGEQYTLKIIYTTLSQYSESHNYNFSVITSGFESLNAIITAEENDYHGYIKIKVISKNPSEKFLGNITIRRASSETNFQIWEDVFTTTLDGSDALNLEWKDCTVESGILYKYCAQKRSIYSHRGLIIQTEQPAIVTLHDMFLTRGARQLRIAFDPKVSSYKRNISDSVTQTIGGKYPYIKRNGHLNYRQFTISGLISHFSDEDNSFMSINDLYKNRKDLYIEYNDKHRISQYNDFTLERNFRNEVEKFLTENNIKLFRSAAEGNILIRLTDINLTPIDGLGRMLYSFSATAHEIDSATIENFNKYKIQELGELQEIISRSYTQKGQYRGIINNSLDIKSYLQNEIKDSETEEVNRTIESLSNIKIQFQSEPYLVFIDNNSSPILGYLIEIDDNEIVVPSSGIYNVNSDEVQIYNNLIIHSKDGNSSVEVIIDYTALIQEKEKKDNIPEQIFYSFNVGQLWGSFESDQDIIQIIKKKYETNNLFFYQRVFFINNLKIEAEPGTLFYLQNSSSEEYQRYEIGATGYLNLENDFNTESLFLLGQKVTEKNGDYNILNTEYIDNTTIEVFENFPMQPEYHGVYRIKSQSNEFKNYSQSSNQYLKENLYNAIEKDGKVNNENYLFIYENGNWYHFIRLNDKEGVIVKPSQFLIDYYYELERGNYKTL